MTAPALSLLARPASAATDDQNLTGLVYLGSGTPLSATMWANNTSFAVYVNHGGSWSTAWRYPAWPSWYITSGGAYSIVLPASQKGVDWANGDPYRVQVDASEFSGTPATLANATSHGTGDAGKISPVGATENAIVWNATDNWQRWDVAVLVANPTRPDYVPAQPQPVSPTRSGLSLTLLLSVEILNQGNGTAAAVSTLAFFNASTPATAFATFPVPLLAPAETSARFTSSWSSPGTPGTVQVVADVDYTDDVFEWNESNNRYTWTVDVLAGPVTNLVVGQPNVTAAESFVTSSTPLSFSVLDQSGTGIRNTTYSVDGGAWSNYTATGAFSLAGDGTHVIEWRSEDFAGNVEPIATATLLLDDSPPTTSLAVGTPKSLVGGTFVNATTSLTLASTDGGITAVGVDTTSFRIWGGTWSAWTPYGSPFTLTGTDSVRYVEYRSADRLGNREAARNTTLVLDNTPPTTTLSPAIGPYTNTTDFSLSATDAGSGVSLTEVRIDGGAWAPYAGVFVLTTENRNISYRSSDRLGNMETELTRAILVEGSPPPAPGNWKPFVALAFASILAVVGAWAARRVPWHAGSRRRLRAFAFTAMPFIVGEVLTGIGSFFTRFLAVPPILGVGTAVDVAILVAGILVFANRERTQREKSA